MKKTNNFSLVELIVLIALAAFFIGVVSPLFSRYVAHTKTDSCMQTRQAITACYRTYMSQRTEQGVTSAVCYQALLDSFETVLGEYPSSPVEDLSTCTEVTYDNICKGGGIYTCRIDAAGQLIISCSAKGHGTIATGLSSR